MTAPKPCLNKPLSEQALDWLSPCLDVSLRCICSLLVVKFRSSSCACSHCVLIFDDCLKALCGQSLFMFLLPFASFPGAMLPCPFALPFLPSLPHLHLRCILVSALSALACIEFPGPLLYRFCLVCTCLCLASKAAELPKVHESLSIDLC